MVEQGFDPGDRLTLEAIQLYLNRVTPDGIVALHISNKRFRLEPVVEKIARELNLAARVWTDAEESRPGKTSSSWVILARQSSSLGVLAWATRSQIMTYGTKNPPLADLLKKYRPYRPAREVIEAEWGLPTTGPHAPQLDVPVRFGPQVATVYQYYHKARDNGDDISLDRLATWVYGPMFRVLEYDHKMELRTDANRFGLPVYPPTPPAKR